MTGVVYVATVATRYPVIGVGRSERQAVDAACRRAWEFLSSANALSIVTGDVDKIREYFGVTAVAVPLGGAIVVQ